MERETKIITNRKTADINQGAENEYRTKNQKFIQSITDQEIEYTISS